MLKHLVVTRLAMTLFHQPNNIPNSLDVAMAVRNNLGDLFTNNPIILPDDAPPEIPRLIFQNENGFQLTVSQTKTDIVHEIRTSEKFEDVLNEFSGIVNNYVTIAIENLHYGVIRMGNVLFARLDQLKNGIQFVNDLYLNRDRLSNIGGTEAHWLYYPTLLNEEVNRWVRIKANSDENKTATSFVEILVDTNTKINMMRNFARDEACDLINALFQDLAVNMEEILRIDGGVVNE